MVNASIYPGAENSGIIFQRVDIEGNPLVKALVEYVVDTSRSTVLEYNDVRISTVEHALSALTGMGIDNAIIKLDAPEMPILDGSAIKYVEAISEVGVVEQNADREYFEIKEPIVYKNEDSGVELMALPADEYSASVMIDYNSAVLGNQFASINSLDEFADNIAPSRTFVFFRDLEFLWKNNLIKGGSLDNAIVVLDREVEQEELDRIADLFNKPRIGVRPQGILSNTKLHYSNEPARHKLLDLIGDLTLVGTRLKGKIIATRCGHQANVNFAHLIKDAIIKEKNRSIAPVPDPSKPPLYDIKDIMGLLPHRPPFLLIDRILELSGTKIIGQKNVTINEPFFTGHFPQEPVMPGVLMVEAMAQCGGILVLAGVEEPETYSTYFLKIDNVRFKRKVVPGDTLIFCLELIEPIRRGIAKMRGQAFVGGILAVEGTMMAQIVKSK
jgi:UDP-3-O-[3-hydroxymyristoyl] N-acetylglucosamine deacetylase/3-hydroxyacyl-[acyl-carrier-protein] dehydratase